MKIIHAEYNPQTNSIDINHYNGAEDGISTTPNSQHALDVLALDYPLEYARLALNGEMQAWVNAEDSMDVF